MAKRLVIRRALSVIVGGGLLVAGLGCSNPGTSSTTSAPTSGSSVATAAPADALTPLVGTVPFPPVPFTGSDGKTHLVYELAVTNFTGARLTVNEVKVEDGETGGVVGDLDGKEVLVVADGAVVGTRNDLPEQTPGTYPAGIPIDEADGNFVVLDVGNGFYVNYAHMQPGSVRPKLGDKVKRGDVIGLVGNTGNSVAPHMHLHVMDGPSPLASQGLPYSTTA